MNAEVKKFYETMAKDEALQAKAKKIFDDVEAKNLPEQERNDDYDKQILDLAKQNGFNFTLEEAKEFITKLTGNFGELSDDDLDQVAGGVSLSGTLPDLSSAVMAYGAFPGITSSPGGTGRW